MKLQSRRLVIFLGGVILAGGGLVLAACSTDNGATPLPTAGGDSGTGSNKDGTTGKDGDNTNEDGSSTTDGGGGGGDCGEAPVLHSNDKGGFYCAFLKARDAGLDAGGPFNCTNDETCCNPASVGGNFPLSYCATTLRADKGTAAPSAACAAQAGANGSTWTPDKGSTWECADKESCGSGEVCCMFTDPAAAAADKVNVGKYLDNTKVPASCNAEQLFKYGGSRCAATCGAKEIQTCSKNDDTCAGGKKCSPFEVVPGGKELAYCK